MQIRKNPVRFSLVFLFLLSFLVFFSIKLVLIQVFKSAHLAGLAEKQHNHLIELEPIRGTIFDRQARLMAFNVPVYSLYANPKAMTFEHKARAVKHLANLLGMDQGFLRDRLGKSKYFVWLKRKISVEDVDKIRELKIKGLGFINESKRFYPNGHLASHVIGFASIDNEGLEGSELYYDKELHGKPGWRQIIRDARQRELIIEKSFIPPEDGHHLVLTIDETIQYIAENALDKAVEKFRAKAATIIVMNPRTGEILALANRPTYDLDKVGKSDLESRTNRAVSYVYEPGSVFKVVTAAAALEEGNILETDKFFCENGKYRIANHTLTDHTSHGTLTFKEVIEVSSNIGTVKAAQKMGGDIIYKYAKRFRFGMLTGIDLKGEVGGWVKPTSQWSKTTIGAIPIGYEITTTPLQLLCAISAIANDGVYMKPFVVKSIKDNHDQIIRTIEPQVVDRVISSTTAKRLTEILVGVVENGTAKLAKIKNVRVAGKTGTARKVISGAYVQGKYYATFMGYAPADNPTIAAIVIVDEPRGSYFGGTVAAPVFKEVVENSLRYLHMYDS